MLFLRLLGAVLTVLTVSGELDQQCVDNCTCCKYKSCGKGRHFPNTCLSGCIDGHRGSRCYELCQGNCKACGSTGDTKRCTHCYDGYYEPNINCILQCPSNCKSCTSLPYCTNCKEGFYDKYGSTTCKYSHCSVGCENGTCLSASGHCECAINFTGDKCSDCTTGAFGVYCNQTCSKYCKNKICEKTTGTCTDGCNRTNMTGNNCSTCIKGMYGEACNKECSKNCQNNMCEKYSGNCNEGCTGNFNGTHCDLCANGKYGNDCDQNCPVNCKGSICKKLSGSCYICNGNFYGKTCEECKIGYYGRNCENTCSQHCNNTICDKNTGKCIHGCTSGFSGDRCCVESDFCVECTNNTECGKCAFGYFNNSCNEKCPDGCLGSCEISTSACDDCQFNRFGQYCELNCSDNCTFDEGFTERACAKSDGKCTRCKSGFFSHTCNETCSYLCVWKTCSQDDGACTQIEGQTGEPLNLAGPIAGGVVALIVAVAGIFVSVFVFRRRKRKESGKESIFSGALSSNRSRDCEETNKETNVDENIKGRRILEAEPVDDVDERRDDDECSVNMNVKVADLFSYVAKIRLDSFEKEFMNLPKPGNLSTLCTIAKNAENDAFNRYNGIYPFDHSRVTIPGEPKFFINACYIEGYNKSKAYIASIGPTIKHTDKFTTFWRMVWQEKSDIIVMLTNLREVTGMKCEQYWPEIEIEQCYGPIKVACRSVEEFAEYTVRSFTISKGKENRNLTLLHFTAWPDKGVPSEVTSVVEFRQRVKAATVVLDGPVIVHCSAGVGRTGTYIAHDILSEQGQVEHSIHIFKCVSKMRQQRVNMVQTVEQYIFLHKALVHTLLFGCEAQTAEEIQNLSFDDNGTFVEMFQTLQQEIDIEKEDDIAAREENKRNYADKSRHHVDIPGHRGRVRLYLHRKSGNHDFINAVFVNSFKVNNLFIAAQTPLSNTVEDFLCMIYQQNSSCVVALEDPLQLPKKHDIGIYLPADNETFKCGDFSVTSSKFENKSQYTMKKLTIKHTYECKRFARKFRWKRIAKVYGEEKIVYHFQYKKWENGRKVPDSPRDFVQFVKDIEKYTKQQKEDMPNVVVHCLNGNERSGLFCVVYTLLEKLEAERQVSVVNVVRKVRAQRKLSISSVKQLKFCYQCISAYLESFNTYSNFAI